MYNMYKEYIPFYLMYPLPLTYEEEDQYMQDYEYFCSLYGETAKKYRSYIDQYLKHNMDAESFIYDEYPDRILLEELKKKLLEYLPKNREMITDEEDLVEVLLYDCCIRERHKRNKRPYQ